LRRVLINSWVTFGTLSGNDKRKQASMDYLELLSGWWDECTPFVRDAGRRWYPKAHQWVLDVVTRHRINPHKVAGITSVLSPGVEWGINQWQTEKLIQAYKSHGDLEQVTLSTYRPQWWKAYRILWSPRATFEVVLELVAKPKGRKTRAFYSMLADPNRDEVVLDRWLSQAVGLNGRFSFKQYRDTEAAIRELAESVGERASSIQAAIWLRMKELKEQGVVLGQNELPF